MREDTSPGINSLYALHRSLTILSTKEEMSGILYTKFGPYDVINPQSHREEHLSLCEGHSKTIKLRITWDDEFQKERSVSLSVPI